ncbi:MAG: hypothetical protein ACM336_13995 [Acidobacteriota bacterium]
MCFKAARIALAAAALAVCLSCGREERGRAGIVAILPFENLAGDPQLDWMGRALADAVGLQLAGTPHSTPLVAGALREVPATGAARTLHGYFSAGGGHLRVNADLEDARTGRVVKAMSARGELLAAAREIARAIDPEARELPTKSLGAMRSYAAGDFEGAVAADPNFGAAYLGWAQSLLARGERARAAEVLAAANGNAARFPALERNRLAMISAVVTGERAAAAHDYKTAAKWYEQALRAQPGDVTLLNQLGYMRAWAGDLAGAVEALSQYRALRPNEANPIDSLGDAHYYLGRFAEAGKLYLEAHAKDASFLGGGELYKAAWARLMQGDLAGADELFARFVKARKDAAYLTALWEHATGRKPLPGAVPPGEAYARLLARDFQGAIAPLEQIYAATLPSSPNWPAVPLAWALFETGAFDRAAQLVAGNPAPDPVNPQPLLPISFPRVLYLRGALAERANRRDEAKRAYELFLRYAGEMPERERARAALARL